MGWQNSKRNKPVHERAFEALVQDWVHGDPQEEDLQEIDQDHQGTWAGFEADLLEKGGRGCGEQMTGDYDDVQEGSWGEQDDDLLLFPTHPQHPDDTDDRGSEQAT